MWTAEAEAELMCFEDEGRSHEPGNIGELGTGKAMGETSPDASKRNVALLRL